VADFSKVPEGRTPGGWVNTQGKFAMRKVQGKNVLVKLATNPSPLVARANAYIGMPSLTNYTIAADVMGGKANDELPDMGVVACRYTLMLDGNKQQLRLVSWDALPRVDKTIRYEWKADAWYHLRLGVFPAGDKAMVRGKVWEQGQDEPTAWTLELEDPTPNIEGSPALYANATGILNNKGAEIFFDQVRIQSNLPPRPKVNSQ
jgi:hypothetical protein